MNKRKQTIRNRTKKIKTHREKIKQQRVNVTTIKTVNVVTIMAKRENTERASEM